MNRPGDSIIHCDHSKPNGQNQPQTRRLEHHLKGDRRAALTIFRAITTDDSVRLDIAARYVLDELGIEPKEHLLRTTFCSADTEFS